MMIHTLDALPLTTFQAAAPVVDARADLRPAVARASGQAGAEWRVATVKGVEGVCFVRRGSGGWNGVVTVCDGRVATLGTLERQTASLTPVAYDAGAMTERVAPANGEAVAARTGSFDWQQVGAAVLMTLGLGLAMKSGAMKMDGARRYG